MKCKKIIVLALAMAAANTVAYAGDEYSVTQLPELDSQSVAVVSPPAPQKVAAPIKNFGVAVWKNSERGPREGLVFRGGTPMGEAAFKFLAELGIKTTINLRMTHTDDQQLCAANGIECLEYGVIPIPVINIVWHVDFRRAFARAAAELDAGHKIFISCQGGRHRTSALVAALTIRNAACGKAFDKEELRKHLEQSLEVFGFHNFNGKLLGSWEHEILEWVDDFEENQWLCE
ncbi:MAG: hypothetical protein A2X28_06855 [Elusimicrobia bacterium GWA2_56_46]|nr:MAG: hypothetical protein A2X28_06855 [Elusimicrobia bacterium GWA2_56_46]OGR54830.1 MAG: hypothetical protein A2X39_11135 [Elusimicrobia bacterium GWC2_56_31]HBB67096.1 hypothetical protein [Elusimicrobiota bacterium]HBW23378.1 hypothetical protein [Elusimicrobiota bacterium]